MKCSARQLVHLAAVVEARSFTVAAQKIGLTQPALSKSIKDLEGRIGGTLFRRSSFGTTPTQLAMVLADYGTTIAGLEEKAGREVDELIRARKINLLVGAPPAIATYLLPNIMSSFLKSRPNVHVKLTASNSATPPFDLIGNVIDLYVGVLRIKEAPAGIISEPLFEDKLEIFVRKGHPLLSKSSIAVTDINHYSWIKSPSGSFARELTETALHLAGFGEINVAFEVESFAAQMNMLEGADFVCMLPQRMLGNKPGLVAITESIPGLAASIPVGVFRDGAVPVSPLVRDFIAQLRSVLCNPPTGAARS